jgi:AhpD family alkylhydroperoxidase
MFAPARACCRFLAKECCVHFAIRLEESTEEKMSTATINAKTNSDAYRAMLGVEKYLAKCRIEKSLRELIKLRVSQINRCAYCIDMHWKDARAAGESEQRLYSVSAWRETSFYSERERAGLLFAEELTRCADRPIAEEVHSEVREQFDEEEMIGLVWAITAINAWNRLNVGLKIGPGDYQPPKSSSH